MLFFTPLYPLPLHATFPSTKISHDVYAFLPSPSLPLMYLDVPPLPMQGKVQDWFWMCVYRRGGEGERDGYSFSFMPSVSETPSLSLPFLFANTPISSFSLKISLLFSFPIFSSIFRHFFYLFFSSPLSFPIPY